MNEAQQYVELIKPFWAPPAWLFGPVWAVLYIIIAVSFGFIFYNVFIKKFPRKLALPFALNLLFNFAFTPLQFGLQNNLLASIDIVLVVATLIWSLVSVWPFARWVFYINIPYLVWGIFATVLQITVTYLNF